MELTQFISAVNIHSKTEIEKVKIIAFYNNYVTQQLDFDLDEIFLQLQSIGHPISNHSRLKGYLSKSKDFKRCNVKGKYMIVPSVRQQLQTEYGGLLTNEDEIVSSNEVLDQNLFLGKRGFLDKLIKQINSCYSNNCYDACAVLMRRVFEIVLILAYENKGVENQIKINGDYVMLERIVANAVQNTALHISRSRNEYDSIRDLGNFAAHKIHFNTRKSDIDNIKQTYRVCLEELYYIAGLLA
ncbi:DUF4145 domain-containing protein [Anaerotruncus rubiinfantis]|uniref:DUF4145 domain-containing protein n=1 Tax=Anaerotruncus rubiinfantis TaxID=1720200 RepID=UPI0034A143BC